MARITIQTRDLGELSFWCPDAGGYVYIETPRRSGSLGDQICEGGRYQGPTLMADAETLAARARRWNRQRLLARRHF